jgi:UDP-N-acetylmuramate dehydrogenase
VVSATLRMEPTERRAIEERMTGYLTARGKSQRVGHPSAGSFFKNPAGRQAWQLIDEAGLRGMSVGGALVSEVHTNFLVNKGGATASDFLALAELVKLKVEASSGVKLEEEVRIVGEG